jgi:hypothetical protein
MSMMSLENATNQIPSFFKTQEKTLYMTMWKSVGKWRNTKNTQLLLNIALGWKRIPCFLNNLKSFHHAHLESQLLNSWIFNQQETLCTFHTQETHGTYAETVSIMLHQKMDHSGFMRNFKANTEFFSTQEILMVQCQHSVVSNGSVRWDGISNSHGESSYLTDRSLDIMKLEMDWHLWLFTGLDIWLHSSNLPKLIMEFSHGLKRETCLKELKIWSEIRVFKF